MSADTMTAGELSEELAEYPDDMPVYATWEGCTVSIRRECFTVGLILGKPALQIDVDLT